MSTSSVEDLRTQMSVAELELITTKGIVKNLQDKKNLLEHAIMQFNHIKEQLKFEKKQLKKAELQELKMRLNLDAAEARDYVNQMNQMEKSGVKLKKGQYSEPILSIVARLPEDTIKLINEFLPLHVQNRVLRASVAKLFVTSQKTTSIPIEMKEAFLHFICNQPESLRLITFKQGLSLVSSGSSYRFTNYGSQTELKNKILMMIGLAMEKNAAFAYKMLKTLVVLGKPNLKLSSRLPYGEVRIGKYLTRDDLVNIREDLKHV
jgi:hypothetical protein